MQIQFGSSLSLTHLHSLSSARSGNLLMHTLLCISTAAKIIVIISAPIIHSAASQVEAEPSRASSFTYAFRENFSEYVPWECKLQLDEPFLFYLSVTKIKFSQFGIWVE